MDRFKRILVGVDLTARQKAATLGSQKAVRQATWIAAKTGGSLTLLHSTWTDGYSEPVTPNQSIVHDGLGEQGRKVLEALVAEVVEQGVACELVVVSERPWLAITHAVLRGEADLVVVAKRNGESSDGRRLGSVAVKLLRKCPSPVWVVKPEHDLVHKLVLAATDLTPVGDQVVRCAAYVAGRQECKLHIVHAYQVPMELQLEAATLSDEEYGERVDEIRERAEERIRASLEGSELSQEPEIHIGRHTPEGCIKEAVEHFHPDLLVMGTISRGGAAGWLVGNTAERLLDRVDCSILTLKPDDFVSPVRLEDGAR